MSPWGRAGQPRTHQRGFAGRAEAGAAAPRPGETSGMWRHCADIHIFLLPDSRPARGDSGAGPGAWVGDTAGQRSQGWRGPGLPSSHPPAPILPGGPPLLRHLRQPSQDGPGKNVLLWAGWAAGHRGAGGLRQRLEATPGGCRGANQGLAFGVLPLLATPKLAWGLALR